jgi:hypothetical protein
MIEQLPLGNARLDGYIRQLFIEVEYPVHAAQIDQNAVRGDWNPRPVAPVFTGAYRINRDGVFGGDPKTVLKLRACLRLKDGRDTLIRVKRRRRGLLQPGRFCNNVLRPKHSFPLEEYRLVQHRNPFLLAAGKQAEAKFKFGPRLPVTTILYETHFVQRVTDCYAAVISEPRSTNCSLRAPPRITGTPDK